MRLHYHAGDLLAVSDTVFRAVPDRVAFASRYKSLFLHAFFQLTGCRLIGMPSSTDPTTVIVAARTAETQAEKILADIPEEGVILWCTPPHNSLVDKLLVRRLYKDEQGLDWGPGLSITDRPEIYTHIEDLTCKLGGA